MKVSNYRINDTKLTEKTSKPSINQSEKRFFAEKYPDKSEEIMNYHYYERSGKLSGVKVGSILDRRG